MKKVFLASLLAVLALASCEKTPDYDQMDSDYLVYTNYDPDVKFDRFQTYYIPDSILIIGDSKEPEYWKGETADDILDIYRTWMEKYGYTRADKKENADLGIQVSYLASNYYLTGYYDSSWWWNYPGYWGPGYWGYWGSAWYYPYTVTYTYVTNSFIAEMVDLTGSEETTRQIPMVWTAYMSGMNYDSRSNKILAMRAAEQAFKQSDYLNKK